MERYRGRGCLSNPPTRTLSASSEKVDDGWYQQALPESIATEVRPEPARSIISRNDSPDIPFEQSINPYRGCEHGCSYCGWGETPVLMGDGTIRLLQALRVGDAIYGTERQGWYRRYVRTRVLAHWSVIKPAFRILLEDGTELVAGADHRFLTERGWKFVQGAERGPGCRPHLTSGNKLNGVGAFAAGAVQDVNYRAGYLCGLIRGDGLGHYSWNRQISESSMIHAFRLARCDEQALDRAACWLQEAGVQTVRLQSVAGSDTRCPMSAIGTGSRAKLYRMRELIGWPACATRTWHAGFLAGIFDAEGRYGGGVLRISHTDPVIILWIRRSLEALGFDSVVERVHRELTRSIDVVRLVGGLAEHLRFFHTVDPAIVRKRDISGQPVKSAARLGVVSIEPLGTMRLYDITTGTEDYIANGIVSHNCYARPSHAYMDLSPGIDFETKIFYKAHAARLLEQELARPGYVVKPITLGSNTDPYQPLERQLHVTHSVLQVLERTRHPTSIITKGALILRDLDLLRSLAVDGLINVFVSITTLRADLKRILEPRTASPEARLRVVRELRAAGIPTGVLVAPVIPALTDSELEHVVAAAVAAGAQWAGYVLLRLPHELKLLFRQWLDEHLPERAEHVMALMRETHGGRESDPSFGTRLVGTGAWAQLLRDRFALACRRHGLSRTRLPQPSCEHFRPPARGGQMTLPL